MSKLDGIYIFCDNKSYHEQWTKNWRKIKGVHTNIKDICNALKWGVKQLNQDSIAVSFIKVNEAMSSGDLNQLEPNYMYTQVFKEILLEMEHDRKQAIKILATYYHKFYHDNVSKLVIVDEFQHDYHPEKAIWWYTRESFTYEILNRALRTLDADIIINMGFFICDLHQQIHQLYQQQLPSYCGKSFTVYRGQGLQKTDFGKLKNTEGGLMSFNNFLSTSNDKDVSLLFAESSSGNTDMVGILFIMTIDPQVSSTPFASIKEVSYYNTEEEILFSMHTVFRVGAINQIDNNDQLYQVELRLTMDDDEQLRQLTKWISNEIGGETGWKRLGKLLLQTGHFHKAEELYKVLLEQTSNESDKGLYYSNLGAVKYHQADYEQAIEYYEKALEIQENTLPENHSYLAISYNNIAGVYMDRKEYSKALSFFEKALVVDEKILPENHPDLATCNNNIGLVYMNMGEYLKALSFFEKTCRIQQKTLPANHPSLATFYSNMGAVCLNMGEYPKALSFYEKVLEIQEKTLPENHHSLATSYNNMGSMYKYIGEYSKALLFYDKTRAIMEKTLPENHPSLTTCYNNIGTVYINMGEYSKALSFLERALEIQEKTLPVDHPDLATSYNNIGNVYDSMREYSKALSFHEKALEIKQKTFPSNHPSLATSYNSIGSVYDKMGEYLKALSFYEKSTEIQEKTLPINRPSLGASYNNFGVLYSNMKEHSKALSYFERALDIWDHALPPNHPNLKSLKERIEIVKKKL
ncbi:unnamed protein product [Adineta steineri]|uniref:Multifunctional fusion protein n=1 Tax=Adineta steineri TaxID=433720 RepID=A0A819S941_9BILA|nr:unnamed protein product [Adineta steineri]CAF4048904.1 unnamed protein product [Adineta steineri]